MPCSWKVSDEIEYLTNHIYSPAPYVTAWFPLQINASKVSGSGNESSKVKDISKNFFLGPGVYSPALDLAQITI